MNNKKVYGNRAEFLREKHHDVSGCENCDESLVFAMRDNYHEFFLGLRTILKCLEIAEKEGYVPKLPPEWWFILH
ncbi:MAG: hypothetical protein RSC52_02015 [Oscillospiraceae bacterium]